MRLERLVVQGFKSFADRLEFVFEPGITAVIGPNGSGKSNVVDAIRWALGEQSLHSLRGERLEDIIFNGSGFRRPHGMAEVSLMFSNEDGVLPVDYSEVTVTRRAYRSGNSEFLLNGVPCRLRDIQDLFADTGIGKDGYAFIGQGKVDEVLNLSPQQRRVFLEQAAGAWKWQRRKKEAEDKLALTEQDLLRLGDVCAELARQREPLLEEARRADDYRTKSNRLKELQIFVGLSEIHRLKEKCASAQGKLAPEVERLQDLVRHRSALEATLELKRTDIIANEKHFEELKNQENNLKQQLVVLEKRFTSLLGDMRERAVRKEAVLAQEEELKIRWLEIKKQRSQGQDELISLVTMLTAKEKKLDQLNDQLKNLELEHEQIQSTINTRRGQTIEYLSAQSAQSNALRSLEREEQAVKERRGRAKAAAEQASRRFAAMIELESKEDQKLQALNEQLDSLEADRRNLEEQLAAADDQEKKIRQECDKMRHRLESSKAELSGLKNIQHSFSSYYPGPRSVLMSKRPGIEGAVAQLIIVPAKYEIAIETALGAAQQFLIADNDEAAAAAIDWLRNTGRGRATFLPLNTIRPQIPTAREQRLVKIENVIGWASKLVEYQENIASVVEYLLGRVLIARDLAAARAAAKAGHFRLKVVTLEGDVVNPGGSLSGGSSNNRRTSQLSQERRLRELKRIVAQGESDLAQQQEITKQASDRKQQLKRQLSLVLDKLQQLQAEITEAKTRKQEYVAQRTETTHNRSVWEEEARTLAVKLEEILREKEQRLKAKKVAEKNLEQWETMAAAEEQRQQDLTEQVEKIRTQKVDLRLEIAAGQEKRNQLTQRTQEQSLVLQQLQQQLAKVEQQIKQLTKLDEAAHKEQETISAQQSNLSAKLNQVTNNVQKIGETLRVLRDSLQDKEQEAFKLLKQEEEQRDRVHTLELNLGRLKADYEGAQRRLFETWGIPKDYDFPQLDIKLTDARSEIERLDQEIAALGDVNLKAPQTLAEINERYDFLTAQAKDVEKAKDTLVKLIRDIEKTVASRLLEKFEHLRDNFRLIFQHLFEGGQADLKLTDEDPNKAGLEIFAQLPGKKMQPLMLLSGGERALTAIAFLFALLRCGQSSLCVLDEIDAPLDETNGERFLRYLEELAQETQFILVTHKKQAMIRAHTIYGLTMAPSGVTNLVSVDLTQAAG